MESTPSDVFHRVTEGETLRQIASGWRVPIGRFMRWYMTEHGDLYDAALKVRADELANETLTTADGADAETVGPAKLQVAARQWLASRWDRERYGDKTDVRHSGLMPTLVIEVAVAQVVPQEREVREIPAVLEGAVDVDPI